MLGALLEPVPGLAGVIAPPEPYIGGVDVVGVVRVDENLAVVLPLRDIVVGLLPARAAVSGDEEAAVLAARFDRGVDDPGVVRRQGQADASHVLLRQAFLQLVPGLAGSGGLVVGRLRPAVDEGEDVAAALIGR